MSLIISPPPVSTAALASGTITRVQSASANSGSTAGGITPINLVFGANLTVGNLVVFAWVAQAVAGIFRILDPNASNFSLIATASNTTGPTAVSVAFLEVQSSGTTCAATIAAVNMVGGIIGVEYSGVKLRPDGMPIDNTSNVASNSTRSITASGLNNLLISAHGTRGTFASEQTGWLTAITNNFTSVLQTSSFINTANTDRAIALCERIVSEPGSYSAAGTQSATAWCNQIWSFQGD